MANEKVENGELFAGEKFAEEKKEWRKIFFETLQKALTDEEITTKVLINRQSLLKNGLACPKHEVSTALAAIDEGDHSIYSADIGRVKKRLMALGYTLDQLNQFPKSLLLKAEACSCYALDNGLIVIEENGETKTGPLEEAYVEKMSGADGEDWNEDKIKFQEELTRLASSLLNSYLEQRGLTERTGLELLKDTFSSNTDNTKALGRVLLALSGGTLTVNGQAPDQNYSLGEYLIHGGRLKFDVSALSKEEQDQFFQFITNGQAESRAYASHRVGGTDASGSPAEIKSGFFGMIEDTIRALPFFKSKHYGINLAVGGKGIPAREAGKGQNKCIGQFPEENGEWGHMYLHKDKNLILVGIEASAPHTANARTGEGHSWIGSAGDESPFLEPKINSEELRNKQTQTRAGNIPLSTKEKNNWASIKIDSDQFKNMIARAKEIEDDPTIRGYAALVNALPVNNEQPTADRLNRMDMWAKATKKGNQRSIASIMSPLLGGLLIIAGIVLAAVPIPVVTQALGGGLIALGIGVSIGVIGVGLCATAVRAQNPTKAKTLYMEELNRLPKKDDAHPSKSVELSVLNLNNSKQDTSALNSFPGPLSSSYGRRKPPERENTAQKSAETPSFIKH